MLEKNATGMDMMLIEGGRDFVRGVSVHLDALSICEHLDAELLVVLSGESDQICDDASSLKRQLDQSKVRLKGVVMNKIRDMEDFKTVYMEYFKALDLPVLGVIPYQDKLTRPTMRFIADVLFAKILAGEEKLDNLVQHMFVGAMSADAVLRVQRFREGDKLVITSGDRSDMILAALDTAAAGIVLTNNILPPANIIARASARNIPLLLVPKDTFQTAKQLDDLIPLLGKEENSKMEMLGELVKSHVDLDKLLV